MTSLIDVETREVEEMNWVSTAMRVWKNRAHIETVLDSFGSLSKQYDKAMSDGKLTRTEAMSLAGRAKDLGNSLQRLIGKPVPN